MSFAAGDKLGPYEVTSRIGVGGMGEVYRAHDSRLNREVAIKVSAEQFNDRFEREARAVAALNHPNICTLYDIGPNYLVMEYVEGENLKGPLPLDEALRKARQIADALEAAHAKGVVHRDLKPGNIRVTPDGTIKVLDFGLAKIGGTPTVPSLDSPTISMAATQAGVILGTAVYMSPEQARGKAVDKRTDIWAFGVVFYEMLTGEQLFQGEDLTDTLAAVVRKEPDWERVPIQVRRLLRACLEKDPKRRLRDIADGWPLLDDAPAVTSTPSRASRSGPVLVTGVLAALFALAAAAIGVVHFRERTPDAPLVRFEILPPAKTVLAEFGPAISPDGRSVAFVARGEDSKERIWIRSLDAVDARALPGTEGERLAGMFWSPDSRNIAFTVGGVLKRIGVDGGPPLTLADTGNSTPGTWNANGVILVGSPRGIIRVPQAGGTIDLVTHTDAPRESVHVFPYFLPDGRHFLYSAFEAGGGTIYVANLDGPDKKRLVEKVSSASYAPPRIAGEAAHLLYLREATLIAQPLDPDGFQLIGDAFPVADGVSSAFGGGIPFFSSSSTGAIAYRAGAVVGGLTLSWFDRGGLSIGSIGLTGNYTDVAISRHGDRVAAGFLDARSIASDIWLMDAKQGGPSRFTTAPGVDATPVWSPDDQSLAYSSDSGSAYGTLSGFLQGLEGGKAEQVVKDGRIRDWSRDGGFLTYDDRDKDGRFRLWVLPLTGDRKPILYPHERFNEAQGQFAPEPPVGPPRWIAYTSDESGANEVYVQSFPPGHKTRISIGGGIAPRWRSDGKELFYLAPNDGLMAVEISVGSEVKKGSVKELFKARSDAGGPRSAFSFHYDVAPDGKSFLIITRPENADVISAPITVVLNWQALKK